MRPARFRLLKALLFGWTTAWQYRGVVFPLLILIAFIELVLSIAAAELALRLGAVGSIHDLSSLVRLAPGLVIILLLSMVAVGLSSPILRLFVRDEKPGPWPFRWGGDEWRLLALILSIDAFWQLVGALVRLVNSLPIYQFGFVTWPFSLLVILLGIYISVRFSAALGICFIDQKFRPFASWGATRGHVLAITFVGISSFAIGTIANMAVYFLYPHNAPGLRFAGDFDPLPLEQASVPTSLLEGTIFLSSGIIMWMVGLQWLGVLAYLGKWHAHRRWLGETRDPRSGVVAEV